MDNFLLWGKRSGCWAGLIKSLSHYQGKLLCLHRLVDKSLNPCMLSRWSWVALGLQTARLALQNVEGSRCYVAIDDTLVFRGSRKAPESRIHHQHGYKVNRPVYVRGQTWVTLTLVLPQGWRSLAVPILSRLSSSTGNSAKLVAAKTLLRVARGRGIFSFLQILVSAHPETPDETKSVSDLETSNFLPDQGNQAFERRRSAIRRTNKCAG